MGSAEAWRDWHTVFTNAKAGMQDVDKAHVQRIVYEMSKVGRGWRDAAAVIAVGPHPGRPHMRRTRPTSRTSSESRRS